MYLWLVALQNKHNLLMDRRNEQKHVRCLSLPVPDSLQHNYVCLIEVTQAETIEFSYVNTGQRNIEEKFHSAQVESYPTSLTEMPK